MNEKQNAEIKYSDCAEAAKELYAENLFEIVRQNYCDANKDYLQKQVQIALEYLTEEQKEELRSKGIQI